MYTCEDSSLSFFLPKVQSDAPLPTPRIDEVLTQFRHRSRVLNPPAESSAQECSIRDDSAKGNQINELRIKKLEQQVSQLFQKVQGILYKCSFKCCEFFLFALRSYACPRLRWLMALMRALHCSPWYAKQKGTRISHQRVNMTVQKRICSTQESADPKSQQRRSW